MPIQGRYLFSAAMDVEPAQEAIFNEVYDTEHVPMLLTVPGVISVARFKTRELTMVIGGERKTIVIENEPRYNALYGVSKVWGEVLGRQFSDTLGLSVLCVRIGRVRAEDRPMAPREYTAWCSQRDIVNCLERCIEAPESLRYDIFFCNSRNKWSYRDLEHPRAVLGWEPMDAAEDHRK